MTGPQMATLEIGSGSNPNLSYVLHNDVIPGPGIDTPGNILDLDFEPSSVSLVFANQLFEHFIEKDQNILLNKIHNWLCIGGGLIIYTPDLTYINNMPDTSEWKQKLLEGGRKDEWDYHIGLVDKKKLREQLEFNNFDVIDMETIAGSIRCTAVKKRIWI